MALGAITRPASVRDYTITNKRVRVRDIVLTSGANYSTGGETITPVAVGLRGGIAHAFAAGVARTTAGGAASLPVALDFSPTDGSVKLQAYVAATGAEQAASANLSTFSVRVTFIGA